jgi:hypothetical protein
VLAYQHEISFLKWQCQYYISNGNVNIISQMAMSISFLKWQCQYYISNGNVNIISQMAMSISFLKWQGQYCGFAPGFVKYKIVCTRLAATSDKVYQLLANGRWFSPGTSASSTTKTGRHDIAEILLKVALSTINQIKSNQFRMHLKRSIFRVHTILYFTKPGANPQRIGDRLVCVAR